MPLVSIGLPVYNGENFLAAAIDSILCQTSEDFELIIADNASTDRTAEICREYAAKDSRLIYYRNERNLGAIANYNLAFERSSGRYFKWAAHDDLIAPTFLERCVDVLERRPEVVLCFTGISYINERGGTKRMAQGNLSLHAGNPVERFHRFVNLQTISPDIFWALYGVIRRPALQQAGLLGKYIASDQVLLIKLLLLGQFHEWHECLFFRREHPQASTISLPKSQTYRERAHWYDAHNAARLVVPNWRLLVETLSAIKAGHLKRRAQAGCYGAIAKMFIRRWKRLARELKSIPAQMLGRG